MPSIVMPGGSATGVAQAQDAPASERQRMPVDGDVRAETGLREVATGRRIDDRSVFDDDARTTKSEDAFFALRA